MNTRLTGTFVSKIGVHGNAVRAWDLNGQLPARHTPAGHRYYTDADCFLSVEPPPAPVRTVAHKNCPCRLGFDWFAYYAESHGCEIRVVNQPGLSPQAEWVEDLMAVVHTFSGRLPGLRRYRKQIREAATDG